MPFYSSAKESPRCHPGTRLYILNEVHSWFNAAPRRKSILWLSGPAGVGKTVIMQSLADLEYKSKQLGAMIFFSRADKRDDPMRFVPTLAYQLVVAIPRYQDFVADQIIHSPSLLHKDSKEMFEKLIAEPFGRQGLCGGMGPWLVLIDGLDICDGGERAQREIVDMVSDFVRHFPESPLVWIIASRPAPWLRAVFSGAENSYRQKHIAIDAKETQKDVELYLRDKFATIRRDLRGLIPPNLQWPSEPQIHAVSRAASGLFLFASTAIRFVRDPGVANPIGRLSIVLTVIEKFGPSIGSENLFSILHGLYMEVLKAKPLPMQTGVVKRILGCCDPPRNAFRPAAFVHLCNFLGIMQYPAYSALRGLHSLLCTPSQNEAATHKVTVLHSSFIDFFRNRKVSQGYYVGYAESDADIVRSSFRILQEANRDAGPFPQPSKIALSWEHQPEKTCQTLLTMAYDGFRLLATTKRGFGASLTLNDQISLLARADFSKLDCYLHPDIKTSVYDTHKHNTLFDWLIDQWRTNSEALRRAVPVREFPLEDLEPHLIRRDRAVIHFRFSLGQSGNCRVWPKVYSGHKGIREKYGGNDLGVLTGILHHRLSTTQLQVWGGDPAKTCLLFTCEPRDVIYNIEGEPVVKEIFFIPYTPTEVPARPPGPIRMTRTPSKLTTKPQDMLPTTTSPTSSHAAISMRPGQPFPSSQDYRDTESHLSARATHRIRDDGEYHILYCLKAAVFHITSYFPSGFCSASHIQPAFGNNGRVFCVILPE
ncbi:hypothetical protein P691DRAFT_666666 [Macrolepiota fuliginosa MF-IS2]|uniref:NACHT domain-containing protein n=1 Tax=Macrolepiota fuliginosa MF-IS2 TaxID=1400762 RepID=A0A9P6C5H6_9AGAR|nr:hypothetical protein P691DRAFT_666666 [Macrolepiota fuliginosa MF-IS2]